MTNIPTKKQLDIYNYIVDFIAKNRIPPSQHRIAKEFSIVQSTVNQHLKALKKKGYIELKPNQSYSIRICDMGGE